MKPLLWIKLHRRKALVVMLAIAALKITVLVLAAIFALSLK